MTPPDNNNYRPRLTERCTNGEKVLKMASDSVPPLSSTVTTLSPLSHPLRIAFLLDSRNTRILPPTLTKDSAPPPVPLLPLYADVRHFGDSSSHSSGHKPNIESPSPSPPAEPQPPSAPFPKQGTAWGQGGGVRAKLLPCNDIPSQFKYQPPVCSLSLSLALSLALPPSIGQHPTARIEHSVEAFVCP